MGDRVFIFDTTLRDGEQAAGCSMTAAEKVQLALQLEALGVDVMEAGFAIASEGEFTAIQEIAAKVRHSAVASLSRAKREDIERSARALDRAVRPRIHTFLATSPIHREHKLRMDKERVLEETAKAVAFARSFVDEVEFSAEDASRTEPEFLVEVARVAADAGATIFNVPDTVGYAFPEEFGPLVGRVVQAIGDRATVSVHCHNDLGLAVANSLAAVAAGARQVECTVNGIGERAGNAALEEIVMALRIRRDLMGLSTGIRTPEIYRTSRMLSGFVGFDPQPNKAVVGRNAFAHESGVHQDGILKERSTYEIMKPEDVGFPDTGLVLGKHSGRNALRAKLEALGILLEGDGLVQVYRAFTDLADQRKKGVSDDEILELAQGVLVNCG
ncbi:2-isopropylmalate synthase [Holophaga foetida]|uniref:2-isopropylmalate synthase n=1 Tax=Holophaga foetida TaxID=35839 RepID=UPI00024753AC|nr:2-isopropylmalate synthase [Holophaga foetida]